MTTPDDSPPPDLAYVLRERDLYRQLLELGAQTEIEPFLKEALGLVVDLAGARRGYIALHDDRGESDEPRFWIAHGCSEVDIAEIRATISQGVIAEAIATRATIVTPSALTDPRFSKRASVRKNRIEAILCAPIGVDRPLGVLYLQDRIARGSFTEEDRLRAETFARHIAALADRLLIRRKHREETDPTLPFRSVLRVEGLIGRSAAMARVLREVKVVAPRNVSVLLTGESGTGKTQIARLIHDNGPRSAGPFIALNCAALPETIFESELFGALPGAHSTADRRVEGKVKAAEHGTLFLDEVAELAPQAQAKLLQFLQSGEYFPLGSARPVKADVRVIAATNTDLKVAVEGGKFRKDLLFRLQGMPIRVPALAERREDIAALAAHLCARACEAEALPHLRLSPGAVRAAEAAEWPGNVREIEQAIRQAAARAADEGVVHIERRHLFPDEGGEAASPSTERLTFQLATQRFQKRLLLDTLAETSWNVTEAANALDITRSHVHNLIRAFGIERKR